MLDLDALADLDRALSGAKGGMTQNVKTSFGPGSIGSGNAPIPVPASVCPHLAGMTAK